MTNTDTADVDATVRQVAELAEAGSELVRVTVNSSAAAAAVPTIVNRLEEHEKKCTPVVEYYRKHAKVSEVDGTGTREVVSERIAAIVGQAWRSIR